jgi:hypothetical protein
MTNAPSEDGRFWILFKDFFNFFCSVTINYTRDDYHMVRISEQIKDETWGVSRLVIPESKHGGHRPAFLSMI